MSEIIFDVDSQIIKNRKKSLLDEYEELEEMTPSIASYRPKKDKHDSRDVVPEDINENGDDWLNTISRLKNDKVTATGHRRGSGFLDYLNDDGTGGKKKKKKDKKKDGPTDYSKEFEGEVQLVQNLLSDQSKFTDSLQKRYDILESSKGSARGIGKFTTDLIGQINQGRSLSAQLVKNLVDIKKTIADLNMKERKELAGNGVDSDNLNEYSASLLKQMLKESRNDLSIYDDGGPVEGGVDDIFANIENELSDSDRPDEVDRVIAYEKRGVEIVAIVNPDDVSDFRLEAIASDNGEILEDYPVPKTKSLNVNRSTEQASDDWYNKYRIIWSK